jgi:tRNA 2-thiouridine synthesizing protein A
MAYRWPGWGRAGLTRIVTGQARQEMTTATPPVPALTIDALGRKCPIPIIMLAQRIGEVPIGSVIAVLADDPAAETDVPAWCMMKSHDHVRTVPLERGWAILIRRGY